MRKLLQSFNKFRKNFVESFFRNKGVFSNSFSFSIVSENKNLKYLNSLCINKAIGLDGIPSRFVRDGVSTLVCSLKHVINLSLIQGFVPYDLKFARVIPLIKKSDKTRIVSEYDQEIPQSQTADNPVAPQGRATQPSRDTRKTN